MTKTIVIDESKCNGCGLCVKACHEGALEIVDGIARLTKGFLCDGIGDCLPACPANAISFKDEVSFGPGLVSNITGAQWPIKIELVSERNPSFDGKHLLIAADCSAFTRPSVLNEFAKDGLKIIGCPKLGKVDQEKLAAIMKLNEITSVDIVRMEVPCCGPLVSKVSEAIKASGKDIPLRTVVLSRDGTIRNSVV